MYEIFTDKSGGSVTSLSLDGPIEPNEKWENPMRSEIVIEDGDRLL